MADELNNVELSQRQLKSPIVQIQRNQAVCVRNACKQYGTKKDPLLVLDGLNMTVPNGVIYGLLGASGCGKTTLLTCIVGRKKLESGDIWVLGGRPGAKGSGVPGPRIGYMPQDIAQYGEFSIRETLRFYGWVSGMKNSKIEERMDFLVQLLMLPDHDSMVKTLSQGQQRRVSLASALLHEPELLILDEPTVGVDPLLREIIWNHFNDIISNKQTTIIITTHYIEETRQADLIGLMRGGCFLAEEPPENLIRRMNTDTLEECFLILSVAQNNNRHRRSSLVDNTSNKRGNVNKSLAIDNIDSDGTNEISGEFGDTISMHSSSSRRSSIKRLDEDDIDNAVSVLPELPAYAEPPRSISDYLVVLKRRHMKALIWKNFLWMLRNIPFMIFLTSIPAVQIALFCLCIGHDPINLPLAVVNYEAHTNSSCEGPILCNSTRLSCNYLKTLQKRDFIMVHYDSEEDARKSVYRGKTYACVVMQHNYSKALEERLKTWETARIWNVDNSRIDILPDKSNKAVYSFVRTSLYNAYKEFIEEYLESCDYDGRVLKEPIEFENPVYGIKNPDFTDYVIPGAVVSLCFVLGACLTAFVVFSERQEGTFQRYLVAGISEIELLSSHFICEFVVSLFQTLLAIVFAYAIFGTTLEGSLVLAVVLIILAGVCGMGYGFCISCICNDERTVNNLIMGSFVPIVTLSGIIWPVEGMAYGLRLISRVLPITQPAESLRCIMQKSWNLSVESVYTGFITLGVWTIIFMTISIIAIKYKKS